MFVINILPVHHDVTQMGSHYPGHPIFSPGIISSNNSFTIYVAPGMYLVAPQMRHHLILKTSLKCMPITNTFFFLRDLGERQGRDLNPGPPNSRSCALSTEA